MVNMSIKLGKLSDAQKVALMAIFAKGNDISAGLMQRATDRLERDGPRTAHPDDQDEEVDQ